MFRSQVLPRNHCVCASLNYSCNPLSYEHLGTWWEQLLASCIQTCTNTGNIGPVRNMKLNQSFSHNPLPSPAIVGHCNLSAANAADVLRRHALYKRFRGIRHMLNFHPDYSEYSEAANDDFLTDKDWIQGFGLLEQYQMSFEMHILPHQMHR